MISFSHDQQNYHLVYFAKYFPDLGEVLLISYEDNKSK